MGVASRPKSIQGKLLAAFHLSGLTYEELGEQLGISKASVHRKLHGSQRIDTEELEVLARILGIQVDVTTIGARVANG